MKKILSLLGAISLGALATTSVVACNQEENKTPETLDGKTFEVSLDSLVNGVSSQENKQDQWGEKSIGFLYSTLWSINNKPAQEEYPIQNQEVAAYLTNGESLVRGADDGANVTINGKKLSEIYQEEENKNKDWHTHVLAEENEIVFNMECVKYAKGEVSGRINVEIIFNIVA